jgi:hypothetical protein
VRLNRAAHDELLRQHPVAMAARVGKMMLVSMPLLLRVFDFGTTYGTLEAGEVRYLHAILYLYSLNTISHRYNAVVSVAVAAATLAS